MSWERMRVLQAGREKARGKVTFEENSCVRNDPLDDFEWPKSTFFDVEDKHCYFWNLQVLHELRGKCKFVRS